MIHTVSGTESSNSSEIRSGYRGALVQTVSESSASSETSVGGNSQYAVEMHYGFELACVNGILNVHGSEISTGSERNFLRKKYDDYVSPDPGIGNGGGFVFRTKYNAFGIELNYSVETRRLWRNGLEILSIADCYPQQYLFFYNPLDEIQYNLLHEDDYNFMQE